jgi:hypothetical protein
MRAQNVIPAVARQVLRNARPAAPRGRHVYPEGRHTEVHAKTVVWQRKHAIPVVQPNRRQNANQEASLQDNARQEAPQQAGHVPMAVPLDIHVGRAVHR